MRWAISAAVPALAAACAPRPPPVVAGAPSPVLEVRLQVIQLSDDDGRREATTRPCDMERWVETANEVFTAAGVRILFEPGDMIRMRDTALNSAKPHAWRHLYPRLRDVAAAHRGRMVVFLRHGPRERPTGHAHSGSDVDFVVMPGFDAAHHCGHEHLDHFAHEVGHYFGLWHTFPGRNFADMDELTERLRSAGGNPSTFDGDRLGDTLPDPRLDENECTLGKSAITIDGRRFELPRDNIMSYYDGRRRLSPLQIRRVRWMAEWRLGSGMLVRRNIDVEPGLPDVIEAETLPLNDGDCGYQDMTNWGLEMWSGGAQLFCSTGSSLGLPSPGAGRYRVELLLTRGPDFGIVQALVDGRPVGPEIDAYAPLVMASGPIDLGVIELDAGPHELRLEPRGKNDASSATWIGLDGVRLVPVPLPSPSPAAET